MAITTLLAYRIDQKTKADKELSDARVALTVAQNDLAAQRANLAEANQELADLVKQTKKIRTDLGEAVTPADVNALESDLAKAISDTRAKQAEIIVIEAAIDTAQTTLDLATANLAAATARGSAVAAALEAADQDKDRAKVGTGRAVRASNSVTISGLTGHPFIVNDVITVTGMTDTSFNGAFTIGSVTETSITYPQTAADATSGGGVIFGKRALRLRHKLATPPLSTMVADATAALAAKPWTDAKARIEADLPQELLACARERAKVESQRLENDKKKVIEIAKLLGAVIELDGVIDKTDNLRQEFDNAGAAFRDYVVNAKGRFDQALAIAARVADTKQNPLTAAENASIHDTALLAKRTKASNARKDMATAQIDVDAKQTNLDIARLKARARDIDADDAALEADADVVAARTALGAQDKPDTPIAKLAKAIKAFVDSALFDIDDSNQDVLTLVNKLQTDSGPTKRVSQFILAKFDSAALVLFADPTSTRAQRQSALVQELNKILRGDSIFEETRFKDVDLRVATRLLISQNPTGEYLIHLNRLLLEDTYPLEIASNPLFKPTYQTMLTDWETAEPDTAWRNLADFEAANRLLDGLETDPAPLVTAMDKAEADLVAALIAAERAGRTLGRLESEALKAASKARFDTGSLPRRALGALRGDS